MANLCSWGKPSGWGTGAQSTGSTGACPTATGTPDGFWWSANAGYSCGGVKNPATLFNQARSAYTTPFYFDADEYGIVCASFPSASGGADPLVSQQAAINVLNTSVANLQTQVSAITAGSITQAPNPDTLAASAQIFGAFVVAGVVAWGLKRIYRLLVTDGSVDG